MSRAALAVGVALAAIVPYLGVVDDYFVQDDFGVVSLLAGKPATAFFGWFGRTWMDDIWGYTPDEIRPFPAVTYQLTALWGAGSPVANHVLNIGLHAANALLVALVGLRAAALTPAGAAFAGAVFALHPVQAETVAWVTGRVDSMPALFYLAAFLAYVAWRDTGAARWYRLSLLLFGIALFSKQNTVTFVVALALYDIIVRRGDSGPAEWMRRYLTYAALTAMYLALRYYLFGEIARESSLGTAAIRFFAELSARHVSRIVAGELVPASFVAALLVLLFGSLLAAGRHAGRRDVLTRTLYFGPVWIAIGLAPTLVAGYESSRHTYLASAGWALTLGLAADALWSARRAAVLRPMAVAAGVLLLAAYTTQLTQVVDEWGVRAAVSRSAVADLEREALSAPPGSLVLVGAPPRSWEWALPFAARPPFTSRDLTQRVLLIYPRALHCCRAQWEAQARQTLARWTTGPGGEVIALSWNEQTGEVARLTGSQSAYLRAVVEALADVESADGFERAVHGALQIATTARDRR